MIKVRRKGREVLVVDKHGGKPWHPEVGSDVAMLTKADSVSHGGNIFTVHDPRVPLIQTYLKLGYMIVTDYDPKDFRLCSICSTWNELGLGE